MFLEEVLYLYLKNTPAIASLVGAKIYPITFPEDVAFPALTYQRISTTREHLFSKDPGTVKAVMQISMFSKTLLNVKEISKAVRQSLQDYTGVMGGVTLMGVLLLSESDDFDDDTGIFTTDMDFEICYKEV